MPSRVVAGQQARLLLTTAAVSYSPLVTDDVPRTRLQPRAVRMVHKLRVTVEEGPDAGTTIAPDDGASLAIGTSEDNALVLRDPAVSRYHLELRRTPQGVSRAAW